MTEGRASRPGPRPSGSQDVQGAQGPHGSRQGPQKSADAYRTISEVAEELDLPQHVLRFWETRFPQVRPLKRAGGRRFYRPEDVALLRAVQTLLYGEGYTIKGVQRLLAEHGARPVAEALARSRPTSSRAAPVPDAPPAGDRSDRSDAAVEAEPAAVPPQRSAAPPLAPSAHPPVRTEPVFPAPVRPDAVSPRAAVPERPSGPSPDREPHPAGRNPGGAALAERLAAVLEDLAECRRLLSSARSTQN